jgi:DNA-binding response OmpR family regulator
MKPRILFMDEDERWRAAVTAYLGGHGYGVSAVGSYVDALMLAKYEDFDLLLVSYDPAGGAGGELCRRIREYDRSTPIILYCDNSLGPGRERLPPGAQGYALKPDLSALSRKLDETLRVR